MVQPGKPLRAQNNTDSLLLHSCMLQALEALPRVNDWAQEASVTVARLGAWLEEQAETGSTAYWLCQCLFAKSPDVSFSHQLVDGVLFWD